MLSRSKTALITFLISLAMSFQTIQASTVLELSFADVVESAELIFEGRVIALEAREDGDGIHTYVSFEVLDIVKGSYSSATLELRYLGGRVGSRQLQITDMDLPQNGESGFYFVESLQENLVHPLVGWDQGRYLIERDRNGQAYVTSSQHRPIQSINGAPQETNPNTFSKGVAKGVTVMELNLPARAMSVDGFKSAVRSSIAEQSQTP
jgi:hypothetical protein